MPLIIPGKSTRPPDKPGKEVPFSVLITLIASILGLLATIAEAWLQTEISKLFKQYKDFISVIGIFIMLVVLIVVVIALVKVALDYYERKAKQTEIVVSRLRDVESDFFQRIESDIATLFSEKVQQ